MLPYKKMELTVDGKKIKSEDIYIDEVEYRATISDVYRVIVNADITNSSNKFLRSDFVSKSAEIKFKFDNNEVKYSGVIKDLNIYLRFIKGEIKKHVDIIIGPEFFGKRTKHNKIYLKKSTPDLSKELVQNYTKLKLSQKLNESYKPRNFCLQYHIEDDKSFFNRILSEDGIFYKFDQESGSVVLLDSNNYDDSNVKIENGPGIEVKDHYTSQIKKYNYFDHSYESPKTDFSADKSNSDKCCFDKDSIELWPYPGYKYDNSSDGVKYIDTVLEHEKAKSTIFEFNFENIYQCINLDICKKFKVKDLNDNLLKEYTIIEIGIKIVSDKYIKCKILAIDAKTTYRPEILMAPDIPLMPAEVIGKEKSQRNVKDNCVQIKFYWQSDSDTESQNYWLRVAQLWAGKSYGSFFRPPIGTEVIVSFLYGPNRYPVVIGCLHDKSVKFPNDDKQFWNGFVTKNEEGKYGTMLIFDDTKDSEKFSINTAKDYESNVQNDKTITIKEGNDNQTLEKGNRVITLEKGDDAINVNEGDRAIKTPSGEHSIAAKTHIITGSNGVTVKDNQAITLQVGDSSIKISNSGIEISAMQVKINGTTKVDINGLMTNLNASGILQCKGGLVKIN
ncbi:MAG: type VI secretion system tip protein VgrG [bacterium]|nr:type VI secretion system tip protein VgrG [bacterium]